MVPRLIFALCMGVGAYSLLKSLEVFFRRRGATKIELRQAAIAEGDAARFQTPAIAKVKARLAELGYKGSLGPIATVGSAASVFATLALSIAGLPTGVAALISVPAVVTVGWLTAAKRTRSLNDKVRVEMIALAELMSAKLAGGSGTKHALEESAGSVQEPLKSELFKVLEQTAATKDLVGAVREFSERYPSPATKQLVAALEIDASIGADIGPALRDAADSERTQIKLEDEVNSDLGQAKMSIQVGALVAVGITAMVFTQSEGARESLFSPIGLVLMVPLTINFVIGLVRSNKMIKNAGRNS